MGKSRRKTPISAITCNDSNKQFKQQEHRRERRNIKQQIQIGKEDYQLDHPKQYGNEWDSPRDGKLWFGDCKYGSLNYYWLSHYMGITLEEHVQEHKEEYARLIRK